MTQENIDAAKEINMRKEIIRKLKNQIISLEQEIHALNNKNNENIIHVYDRFENSRKIFKQFVTWKKEENIVDNV